MMNSADIERMKLLADDLHDSVFAMMDSEFDVTGAQAAAIAGAVQIAFEAEYAKQIHGIENCSDCKGAFGEERIDTFSHSEPLALCRPCYNKRGNTVR